MTKVMMKQYNVVAGVIVHNGRVLCVKKGITKFGYTSNKWEFPGGKIEAGESNEQALERELREELNMNVTVGEHLVSAEHAYPDFGITLHAYICDVASDDVTLKEHIDRRWLLPESLSSLEWCGADVAIARAATTKLSR